MKSARALVSLVLLIGVAACKPAQPPKAPLPPLPSEPTAQATLEATASPERRPDVPTPGVGEPGELRPRDEGAATMAFAVGPDGQAVQVDDPSTLPPGPDGNPMRQPPGSSVAASELRRVSPSDRDSASPPAQSLVGTAWWQAAPGAVFRNIHFLPGMVSVTTADGQTVVMTADYTAQHVECGGYPTCIFAVQPNGSPMVFYFARMEGLLVSLICNSAYGLSAEDHTSLFEQVRNTAGGSVVYDQYPAICWNAGGIPFREVAPNWTLADETRYQEANPAPPAPADPTTTP